MMMPSLAIRALFSFKPSCKNLHYLCYYSLHLLPPPPNPYTSQETRKEIFQVVLVLCSSSRMFWFGFVSLVWRSYSSSNEPLCSWLGHGWRLWLLDRSPSHDKSEETNGVRTTCLLHLTFHLFLYCMQLRSICIINPSSSDLADPITSS